MKKIYILFIVFVVLSTNLFTAGLSFIPSHDEVLAAEMKMGGKKMKMNHGKQGMKMEMATTMEMTTMATKMVMIMLAMMEMETPTMTETMATTMAA